jgi:hypothetical protein
MSKETTMLIRVAAAAALVLGAAGSARAQTFQEVDPSRAVPGWVMTPGVSLGTAWDDNLMLSVRGNPQSSDLLTSIAPTIDLTYRGRQTLFGLDYRGTLIRYRTLGELDSFDQGGAAFLEHQPSKRVTLRFRNAFSVSPTTDPVQVVGVPFYRTGTRQNMFTGSAEMRATERLQLSGSYGFQWLQFDDVPDQPVSQFLEGGTAHTLALGAMQALSRRVAAGAGYSYQRALIGSEAENVGIQNVEGRLAVQLSPTVMLDGGFGLAYLSAEDGESRTGPAGRVSISKQAPAAVFTLSASRSFVPSFGYGGGFENSELVGSVSVPFARNRAAIGGALAWRSSEPLLTGDVGFTGVWVDTSLGYAVQRWLRVEGFYSGAFQQTTVVGGRIDRNRFGIRLATQRPMRIQ